MESSELTSLDMTKIQIISSHLNKMDEKRMEVFKKSLCQLKPRRGAGRIKMGDIKNKSIGQMVEFVFRCHTDRRAVATIRKALEKANENQIKKLINRDIASKSNAMVEKQGTTQACKMTSIKSAPTYRAVSSSEPSAKRMKQAQDRDALLEASKKQKATSSDNEGQRPAQQVINQEPTHVNPTQGNIANNSLPRAPKQQFGVTLSHASSKEQTQVNLTKASITNNTHPWAPNELFRAAPSHTSSKEQPQINQTRGNITKNTPPGAHKLECVVALLHAAAKEPPEEVIPKQPNVTNDVFPWAPNYEFGLPLSRAFSKQPPQVNLIQGNITNHSNSRAPNKQMGVAFPLTSSKEPPQVSLTQDNITNNSLLWAPKQQFRVPPYCTSSKEPPPQANHKQSSVAKNLFSRASDEQFGVFPSKEPTHVNPTQGNITNNSLPRAPKQQFGVTHSHISSKEQPQGGLTQSNINVLFIAPNHQYGVTHSHTSSKEQPQFSVTQGNIANTILFITPKQQFGIDSSHTSSKEPPHVNPTQDNFTNHPPPRAPNQQLGLARSLTSSKEQLQVSTTQSNSFGTASSHASSKVTAEPPIISLQGKVTNNTIPRAPNQRFGLTPKEQPQVSMIQSNITINTFLIAPNQKHRDAPSHTSSKAEQPQISKIQANTTKTLSRGPNEQVGVAPSHRSSKEPPPQVILNQGNSTNIICRASNEQFRGVPSKEQPQVNPIQSNITTMLPRGPSEQVTPSHISSKEPPPQVNPKQSNAKNTIHRASNEQFTGAPFKAEQQQVNPTQGNVTKNTFLRAPSEKYGTVPSHTSSKVKEHFVDRHRRDLIDRMYALQRILDDLLKRNVLTQRQHVSICRKTTHREQMTELYDYVRDWSDGHKDELYDLLEIYNQSLILNLIHQEM